MALVVEDGTGKADADSYLSLSDYKTYCTAHGHDLAARADADLESDLRNATIYIDANYRFRSTKRTADQALEFPRAVGAVDRDGLALADVPSRLKWAEAELAFIASSGDGADLQPPSTMGIKSESVGPISVTYTDNGVPSQTAYIKVTGILRPITRLDQLPPQAVMTGPTSEPFFGVNLHDPSPDLVPGAVEDDTNSTLA